MAVADRRGIDRPETSWIGSLRSRIAQRGFKWVILLPALAVLLITAVFPTLWIFYNSLFNYDLMMGLHEFIGLGNYVQLLTDPQVWHFAGNTVVYVLGSVGIGFPIALGLAKLLSLNIRFRTLWLVAIILPWVFPQIAGAIMWQWMIHQQYGVLNYLLRIVGLIDQHIAFLAHTWSAFLMLVVVDMWYWTPFATLILFGGFTRVPNQLLEAAQLDGASAWQTFFKVELPYIMPEILAAMLLRTMFTFREFGIPFLLGKGGPARSTEVLGLTIYRYSISWLQLGAGAALSVLLLAIMVLIVIFYFRIMRVSKGISEEQVYE